VLACPDLVFPGTIENIASSLDSVSRSLSVRAILDNSEGVLKPNMFARVKLVIPET
jgi:multidrug efflux pump subunit AcrA (membrane-fusion protein)